MIDKETVMVDSKTQNCMIVRHMPESGIRMTVIGPIAQDRAEAIMRGIRKAHPERANQFVIVPSP